MKNLFNNVFGFSKLFGKKRKVSTVQLVIESFIKVNKKKMLYCLAGASMIGVGVIGLGIYLGTILTRYLLPDFPVSTETLLLNDPSLKIDPKYYEEEEN